MHVSKALLCTFFSTLHTFCKEYVFCTHYSLLTFTAAQWAKKVEMCAHRKPYGLSGWFVDDPNESSSIVTKVDNIKKIVLLVILPNFKYILKCDQQ